MTKRPMLGLELTLVMAGETKRKSKKGDTKVFSSLRSIHWETDGKKNRIDFPKQIRIKRKYLLVVRRKSSEEGHTADA